MKTTTKTEQTNVVTNVEVANDGVIRAETTAANESAAQSAKIVNGGKYAHYVKVEHDMAEELLVGKTRKEYVADFNVNLRKTAEATLLMCRTVFEASKMLAEHDFGEFCKNIGYRDSSSTIRGRCQLS